MSQENTIHTLLKVKMIIWIQVGHSFQKRRMVPYTIFLIMALIAI
jgi:hypothetical protein